MAVNKYTWHQLFGIHLRGGVRFSVQDRNGRSIVVLEMNNDNEPMC